MTTTRVSYLGVVAGSLMVFLAASLVGMSAQGIAQGKGETVRIGNDDLGGVVTDDSDVEVESSDGHPRLGGVDEHVGQDGHRRCPGRGSLSWP